MSGAPHSVSGASTPGWSGAAGSSDPDGAYFYNDFDDSSEKEEAVHSFAALKVKGH